MPVSLTTVDKYKTFTLQIHAIGLSAAMPVPVLPPENVAELGHDTAPLRIHAVGLNREWFDFEPVRSSHELHSDIYAGTESVTTGFGTATSGGTFSLVTAVAGASGVSGGLSFKSGTTSKGSSGSVMIRIGSATSGTSGSVIVPVTSIGSEHKIRHLQIHAVKLSGAMPVPILPPENASGLGHGKAPLRTHAVGLNGEWSAVPPVLSYRKADSSANGRHVVASVSSSTSNEHNMHRLQMCANRPNTAVPVLTLPTSACGAASLENEETYSLWGNVTQQRPRELIGAATQTGSHAPTGDFFEVPHTSLVGHAMRDKFETATSDESILHKWGCAAFWPPSPQRHWKQPGGTASRLRSAWRGKMVSWLEKIDYQPSLSLTMWLGVVFAGNMMAFIFLYSCFQCIYMCLCQ